MEYNFKVAFDPVSDISPVEPDLAIDITMSIKTGQVSSTARPLDYTNEESCGDIGSYVRDNIDALQIAKELGHSMVDSIEAANAIKAAKQAEERENAEKAAKASAEEIESLKSQINALKSNPPAKPTGE